MGNSQSTTVGPETLYTATAASSIAQAAATALTLSPTSNVKGKTFDRFVQIFLENQDYSIAAGDRRLKPLLFRHTLDLCLTVSAAANLAYLGTLGITLTNYYAITHPSQVCPTPLDPGLVVGL